MNQRDLARILKMSPPSVSRRMVGRVPWRADEVYTVLRAIGADASELAAYFPPRGGGGRNAAC